ncbi:hypothetical protein [Alteromonas ponticola]|uniref:Uncharacterized protein n=1 Tax=Alteromonas ponticola TaxID=2720613 RepID=A0ABX1R2Z1_9ALTE|nr:hypothetical protein [Alteromonas ponticola]NMH60001.1 hypothetical protein [Alteromonas ponticola]
MDLNETKMMLVISRRLIIFAILSLILTTILFALSFVFHQRLMLSWLVFECGIIGGFVSIQQRLKHIDIEEMQLLSQSWFSILMIPVYGGIFALVLYILFLAGLVQGHLFPAFYVPEFDTPPTTQNVVAFLTTTYPAQGADIAKLIFWSFVAGFSERFVPQIINDVTKRDAK